MNDIKSLPLGISPFPYTDHTKKVMVVDVHDLSKKMLKSMSKERALKVARDIYNNHTVNEADKSNWFKIIEILNGRAVNKGYYIPEHKKSVNAGYKEVDTLVIGQVYHVIWAHKGCVWKLVKVSECGNFCTLKTIKTRKELKVKRSDLRHVRKNENNI